MRAALTRSMRVAVDRGFDRARADAAEARGVAREHDAVDLGAVHAARLVGRALEGADLAEAWIGAQQRSGRGLDLAHQGLGGLLGRLLLDELSALRLVVEVDLVV